MANTPIRSVRMMRLNEAATYLECNVQTLLRWRKKTGKPIGKRDHLRKGNPILFTTAELDEFRQSLIY